jgi:hypothetical protein
MSISLLYLTSNIANIICFSIKQADQAKKDNEETAHNEPADGELANDELAKDEPADEDNVEIIEDSLTTIAKHHLVVIATSVCDGAKLSHIVACHNLTDLLPSTIEKLMENTMRVLCYSGFEAYQVVGDGAKENASYFKAFADGFAADYIPEELRAQYEGNEYLMPLAMRHPCSCRPVFFLEDMPHVIKRIVNALERSSLKKEKQDLRYSEKQPMTLRMIQLVWEAIKGASLNMNGYGLTKEHFIKDAYSRMRVKLSMQVLSNKAYRMMVKALNDPMIQSTVRSKYKLYHTQFYRLQQLMVHVNNLVDIVNGVVAKTGQRAAVNFTPETGLFIQKALLEILEFFSKWEKSVLDNPKLGEHQFLADETWTGIKRMILSYVGTIQYYVIGLKHTIVPKRTTSDPLRELLCKMPCPDGINEHCQCFRFQCCKSQ